MRSPRPLISLLLLACTLTTSPSLAQMTGKTVLENMRDAYLEQMKDVDDFTVVTKMEGAMAIVDQLTTYYKKVEMEGRPAFETRVKASGGMADMMNNEASTPQRVDVMTMMNRMYERFGDTAQYEGTETVDGEKTHVLLIEDLSPLFQDLSDDSDQEMKAKNARIYVDAATWMPRKISAEMEVDAGGEQRSMQWSTLMQDYRKVGPMLHPHLVKTVMENPMSPEERAEVQKQMEAVKAQLDKLPEAQRKQMEKMLQAQQGPLGGDTIEMSMVTQDVKVNAGVPAELFQ
jgi:hypothetical protein